MTNTQHPLFNSLSLDHLHCPNRVVMAPLTRNRAGDENVPTDMNARYYQQRASAGLIITEATIISPRGQGYPRTPGIYSTKQVEGWQKITDAVHEEGGRIFLQLWHVGRISHSSYHNGKPPVAPSAIKPEGKVFKPDFELVPFETPRALSTNEISSIVNEYEQAAQNARQAGFDGVEIHAANGYLIDQFLRSGTNRRDDQYGGSIENRTRFLREVTEAVTDVWKPDRVGVRLSPLSEFNDMKDSTPAQTFGRAARIVSDFEAGYLHLVEPLEPKPPVLGEGKTKQVFTTIRDQFDQALMANGNYDLPSARKALEAGYADIISFGRAFLANPDLPRRLQEDLPINQPDKDTFYGGDETGYTDYPTWEELDSGKRNVSTISSLSELSPWET